MLEFSHNQLLPQNYGDGSCSPDEDCPPPGGFFCMTGGLTPKQERFVEEYLTDLNATQAAIRAGYSEESARSIGCENLTKPDIQDAIAAARKALAEGCGITLERVQKEYARLAFLDIRKAFDEEGRLKPIHELDDDTAAAILGLEVETLFDGKGQDREIVGRLHKIKLSDKRASLDSIAKLFGWVVDKKEVTGKDGGPIVTQTKEQRDAAVAAALAADA